MKDTDNTCQYCGTAIFKRLGFWNMWQARECSFGDPEYCSASQTRAHKPAN